MRTHRLSYASTGRFSPLVLDLLAGRKGTTDLFAHGPSWAGLLDAARQRQFSPEQRAILVEAIQRQYVGVDMGDVLKHNLEALARAHALTVTTGHQLCLFGGPLYVPFKILNVVRIARELSDRLQGRPVIPVFWMATEDHDRAEIDHVWIDDHPLKWPGSAGGAVGRMPLEGIEPVVEQAIAMLGPGGHAGHVADLIRQSWRPEHTLAQATRSFTHALFGHFGLVCVDGDDPALKRQFAPVMARELIEQCTLPAVAQADAAMGDHYVHQAHARPINLFHLRPGQRARIVHEQDHYRVLNGGPHFTREELMAELDAHPESFSPNVLLRPLYQETVLPNVAYVGGGGELAYWAQLKAVFHTFDMPMPVVLLRTSAGFMSEKHLRQWNDLGLSPADLFAPPHELQSRVATKRVPFAVDMDKEVRVLHDLFNGLSQRVASADPGLQGAVEARRIRALKDMERLGMGLVRAARQREQTTMHRMDVIQQTFLPGGGLQERRESILPRLAAHGMEHLSFLLEQLDPLDGRFTVIEEP